MSALQKIETFGKIGRSQGDRKTIVMYTLLFSCVCLASQILSGGYGSDQSQTGDEAAHFVTALMIHDYLAMHLGENFLRYAREYYAHFPRVGLGHWPPMFELTQALIFFISRSKFSALGFQALIGGLLGGLPAAVVARKHTPVVALAAGSAVLLAPFPLFLSNTVMADNFLAVLVFATAMTWERFYRHRNWKWCAIFSCLALAAMLTKGSAVFLALLPVIYAAVKGDLKFLFDRRVLASGAFVALFSVPWYVATYKLAASGFNYSWGASFILLTISTYPKMLLSSVGIPIVLGYLFGLWSAFSSAASKRDDDVISHAAASFAMLLSAIAIPADVTPRYLIPALPGIAIVAVFGISSALSLLPIDWSQIKYARNIALIGLLVISTVSIFRRPHVEPFGAADVVEAIAAQRSPNPLVLVSGSARYEGALIAAFALAERKPQHYVVRATKVLASGNFMGSNYTNRFASAAAMRDWIVSREIGFISICDDREGSAFGHNQVLQTTIRDNPNMIRTISQFDIQAGQVKTYALTSAAIRPSPDDPIFSEIQIDRPR